MSSSVRENRLNAAVIGLLSDPKTTVEFILDGFNIELNTDAMRNVEKLVKAANIIVDEMERAEKK